VVDTPTGAYDRFLVVPDVPGHPNSRLEHLGRVRYRAVRWESRIGQIRTICSLRRRYYRIGKCLSLPTQAVIECDVRPELPFVLQEERIVVVVDVRGSGREIRQACRSSLEIEQQWTGCGLETIGACLTLI